MSVSVKRHWFALCLTAFSFSSAATPGHESYEYCWCQGAEEHCDTLDTDGEFYLTAFMTYNQSNIIVDCPNNNMNDLERSARLIAFCMAWEFVDQLLDQEVAERMIWQLRARYPPGELLNAEFIFSMKEQITGVANLKASDEIIMMASTDLVNRCGCQLKCPESSGVSVFLDQVGSVNEYIRPVITGKLASLAVYPLIADKLNQWLPRKNKKGCDAGGGALSEKKEIDCLPWMEHFKLNPESSDPFETVIVMQAIYVAVGLARMMEKSQLADSIYEQLLATSLSKTDFLKRYPEEMEKQLDKTYRANKALRSIVKSWYKAAMETVGKLSGDPPIRKALESKSSHEIIEDLLDRLVVELVSLTSYPLIVLKIRAKARDVLQCKDA